jgi:cytochrome P450
MSNNHRVPVFKGHWLLGNVPAFRRDPIAAFTKGWAECGDLVHFRIAGPISFYLLAHPSDIKHVLQDNHENYQKDPLHSAKLKTFAGQGLTMSEGALWQRQSRLMRPAFRPSNLDSLIPDIVTPTTEMLESWRSFSQSGQPIDVSAEMLCLSLRIVMRALFDVDPYDKAGAIVDSSAILLDHAYREMRNYIGLPNWLPSSANRRFLAARHSMDQLAYDIIDLRRRTPNKRKDLLSLLLEAASDKKAPISDKQIRDEMITMILAGHDTTGVALAWTMYLLAQHPAESERVAAELSAISGTPRLSDNLSYTEAVFDEAMRLFPPAWVLSRKSLGHDEFRGYRIPPGSNVFLSPFITQRHPDFWQNPDQFVPERFTATTRDAQTEYAYFPFGGGSRQCIGRIFALTMAKFVLTMVLRNYRLSLPTKYPVRPMPKLTLHPESNIVMRLERI